MRTFIASGLLIAAAIVAAPEALEREELPDWFEKICAEGLHEC